MEGKDEYKISGIGIRFPYKPYGPQLAFMGKIVSTLERAFRDADSHCNALLESPTGSGKSLALLCASLAWQQHRNSILSALPVAGGGFIPDEEDDESRRLVAGKLKAPTIYFATRTHSQISQVVHEFRKTSYRVPMAILAARKHYCTNKHVSKKANIDEECNILVKDPQKTCPQFKNVYRLKSHTSLQKGGSNEIHDIEDLVDVARTVRGCAYFASRELAQNASIVFCPYSYILNPTIRKAMAVDIQGAVVIFDEAHNIEDMAREAGSFDLAMNVVEDMRTELEQLSGTGNSLDIYQPLLEMVQELLVWMNNQVNIEKQESQNYAASWTGLNALEQLRSAGISSETFSVLLECATKAVGASSDSDPSKLHLTGRAAGALEGLFSSLRFLFLRPDHMNDYQLVLQKNLRPDEGGSAVCLSLWCLNPAVVFQEIASFAKSVILTSGTLSPMSSFASELGVRFEASLEASHIIDMNKQISVSTVSFGPRNTLLNASYKSASTTQFQDDLGKALEQIYEVVPDGALVFFPSYTLLDKLCARWKFTGQWNKHLLIKDLFIEPRGKTENFERVLSDFYKAIAERKQKGPAKKAGNGAAFLAVCRGKVSEGINFSDENARVVIIVGIPFPNVKDLQVGLKKQYNNTHRNSKSLLGGDQWYCHQAFRALNQAVGRCIRHREDYGAILLMDERFNNSSYLGYMSKWLRKSVKRPGSFAETIESLRRFFCSFQTPSVLTDVSSIKAEEAPFTPLKPCFQALFRGVENTPPDAVTSINRTQCCVGQCSSTQTRKSAVEDIMQNCIDAQSETVKEEEQPSYPTLNMNDSQVKQAGQVATPVADHPQRVFESAVEEERIASASGKERLLCCSTCGSRLGHPEQPFQRADTQKAYFVSSTGSSSPVLVLDSTIQGLSADGTADLWVEQDGCVFRPVHCSCCKVRLGARIMASDSANTHLQEKVLLSSKHVVLKEVPPATTKRTSPTVSGRGKLKLRRT